MLRVLRRPRDGDQAQLRSLWDRFVSNSAVVEETTTDRYLVERLVPSGVLASLAETPALIEAFETVCHQYSGLMAASSFGVLGDYREDVEARLRTSSHLKLIHAAIASVGEKVFWSLRVVPMGSDASPDNAIITEGNVAFFVDTEPLYLRPVICHPLGVIAGWDQLRGELIDLYLGGSFDDELEDLIPGLDSSSLDPKARMAWLVLAVLVSGITPEVIRRKMRPLDGLLQEYGIEERARNLLFAH